MSLPPNGALPSYFSHFHLAPYQRSYFPRLPLRPPSRRFRIAPLAAKATKREPKHWRCFWEKSEIANRIGTVTSGVSSDSVFLRAVLILISLVAYFVHVGSLSSDAVLVFKSLQEAPRSCTEIFYRDLTQRSYRERERPCTEILSRDLLKRSCLDIS